MVPFYLKRIHDVHRAAMRGRLQEITKLLDHKSFAIATDQLGATPLHKAVWYENYDVAEYIVNNFPLSLNITDMDGRTPLHYAAVLRDNKDMYNILLNGGASKSVQDIKGKIPDYYLQHPELLKIDEVIRRNQRINATHMANIINHTRSKLPLRRKYALL
ncbi:ankyrin repeat domain-containing protein 49-like [Centruroides sculpturatus]|uniref:ankyrin repeat domain-containing protein 49-like n=1 Tax=Centruroides sculpturatus TaxID=218467 RepID=UPI000C6CF5BF|nr:ankyrin repeat domain-containing protein 49-like [Centruroides sculpturatus]